MFIHSKFDKFIKIFTYLLTYCLLQENAVEPVRNARAHNGDDVFDNDDIAEADTSERTRLLPSATVSEAERCVPSQGAVTMLQNDSRTYKTDWKMEQELVLRVVRPAAAALGISVAGGAGSTPYRTNDHVRCHSSDTKNR